MNIRLCFRVSKEAGMAEDEVGNSAETFVCAALNDVKTYNLPPEDYKTAQEGMRILVAKQLGCSVDMLTPITLNEYLDNTEE